MRLLTTVVCLLLMALAGCGGLPGSALIGAARSGDAEAVRRLLQGGANPNEAGGVNGWPVLMHAVHKGQHRTAAALLDGGANPNLSGAGGYTALMMASGYGDAEMVRLLLRGGADPKAARPDGTTALSLAVSGVADIDNFTLGKCQTGAVRVLLEIAPKLELPEGVRTKLAKRAKETTGCAETLRLIESRRL